MRYSTFAGGRRIDISQLSAVDLGDVEDPDGPDGEARVSAAVGGARERHELLIALGGDNSITYPLVRGVFGGDLAGCGLITFDAHHDLRDGETNGSPVRRLVEAGLPGANIVQIGIADFSNSAAYAARAIEYGITVIHRSELQRREPAEIVAQALEIAGRDGREVFVDVDVDVCDRAEAPACPAAAPGGVSADELRRMVFVAAQDPRVRGMDITEIDAAADAPDQRTVRLGALLVFEAAAGACARR
jgi:formiminoglutamase